MNATMNNSDAVFEAVLQTASAYAVEVKNSQDVADPHLAEAARQHAPIIQAALLADAVVSLHRIARALERLTLAAVEELAGGETGETTATRSSSDVLS